MKLYLRKTFRVTFRTWTLILMLMMIQTNYGVQIDSSCSKSDSTCVCSIEKAQTDIHQYFAEFNEIILEQKIRTYECTSYERLPKQLDIDVKQMQPPPPAWYPPTEMGQDRSAPSWFGSGGPTQDDNYNLGEHNLRRRLKRQALLGVPTNENFNEAIAFIEPSSFHQYVILGSSTTFSCSGPEEGLWRSHKFKWSHFNGEPVTSPLSSVDPANGLLIFGSVQISDTGIYNCTIEYYDDNGQLNSEIYSHQLSVISGPIFSLKFRLHYNAYSCSAEEKFVIKASLEKWVHELICPMCQVHNASVHCIHERFHRGSSSEPSVDYEINLVLSLIGVDLKISKEFGAQQYTNVMSCASVSCLELYQVRLLEIVRDSLIKLFSLRIILHENGPENEKILDPIPESLEMNILLGCLAGFHFKNKICFPCDIGHYSPDGSSNCFPCTVGHYQSLPGSSMCKPCEDGYTTHKEGSTSKSSCTVTAAGVVGFASKYHVIIFTVLGLLITFIIILVCIRCCCPNTTIGRCVSGYCCCCCPSKEKFGYEESIANEEIGRAENSRRKNKANDTRYTRLSEIVPEKSQRDRKSRDGRYHRHSREASNIDSFNKLEELQEDEDEEIDFSEDEDETLLMRPRNVNSTVVRQKFDHNPYRHRCVKSSPAKAAIHSAATARKEQTIARNYTIPKPPPLPNYSYT